MYCTQVFGTMKHTLFIGKNGHGTLGDVKFILIERKAINIYLGIVILSWFVKCVMLVSADVHPNPD